MRNLFLASLLSLAAVECSAADSARMQLTAFGKDLRYVRGDFVQEVHDAQGKVVELSSGTLALAAPRQFRWQYEKPFPQLIVADGDNVWIYDEDLAQATVKNQSFEEAQSPLTVLTDLSQLDRQYQVSEQGEHDGARWLALKPKSDDAPFDSCELAFADGALTRMVLHDHLGQKNQIRFGRWERNPKIDPAQFHFTPPKGVDVVGEPVKNATVTPLKD